MNRRQTSFHQIKPHTFLDLDNRPGFKSGSISTSSQGEASITNFNKRNGRGDRLIERPGFIKPPVKARTAFEFLALEAIDIANSKASLEADGSLQHIKETWILLPDPTDFLWLSEKERLTRVFTTRFKNAGFADDQLDALVEKELRINPPFGRGQRTFREKTTNIKDQATLSSNKKLKELLEAVKDEGNFNTVQINSVLDELYDIVRQIDKTALDQSADIITQITAILQIKPTFLKDQIGHRFIDGTFFRDNIGKVSVFIETLAADNGNDPRKPIIHNGKPISILEYLNLSKLVPNNSFLFFDKDKTETKKFPEIRTIANSAGVDPNIFSFDIARFKTTPGLRVPPKKPALGPTAPAAEKPKGS